MKPNKSVIAPPEAQLNNKLLHKIKCPAAQGGGAKQTLRWCDLDIPPSLDLTLQNPGIATIDNSEPFKGIKGMKLAATTFADGEDLNNYLISPLNGIH